jgi:hypothetical protein
MAKISQRQVLATISPTGNAAGAGPANIPKWEAFKFAQVSGGEITAAVERIYEGGDKFPKVLCAPYEIGDITLTAHYDDDLTEADSGAGIALKLNQLRDKVGSAYYDITVKTYDCDILVKNLDRQYGNALLVGLTEPEGDASSGAPATFALTFAVQGITGGGTSAN